MLAQAVFGEQNDGRVVSVHCGPQQTSSIFWRAGDNDTQTGHVCKVGFIGLTVPISAARQVRSVGSVNYGRASPLALAAPANCRQVLGNLVLRRANKVDELDFKNWPHSVAGQASSHACDGGFRQW